MAKSLFNLDDRKLLWRLAQGLERYNLTVPAIFYLEMHRPIAFIMSSFLLTLRPIVFLFMDSQQYTRVVEILEKQEAVEELIKFLELAAKAQTPQDLNFENSELDNSEPMEDPILAGKAMHELEVLSRK